MIFSTGILLSYGGKKQGGALYAALQCLQGWEEMPAQYKILFLLQLSKILSNSENPRFYNPFFYQYKKAYPLCQSKTALEGYVGGAFTGAPMTLGFS